MLKHLCKRSPSQPQGPSAINNIVVFAESLCADMPIRISLDFFSFCHFFLSCFLVLFSFFI